MRSICFSLLFLILCLNGVSQTVTIHVTGIRNPSGNIRLAFYSNSKSFDKETPLFIRTVSKKSINNNSLRISYHDLKPGIYGIAILDDENANEKMDYSIFYPKKVLAFRIITTAA